MARVVVSARGVANGRSSEKNHGFAFGPDTPNTRTGGLQEAIHRVFELGGGVVDLDPSSTIELHVPLTLRSHVWIEGWGATLHNAERGPNTVRTPPGEVTTDLHVRGLRIDAAAPTTEGFALDLVALQASDLDLSIVNAHHGIRLHAPSEAKGSDPLLHANVCLNRFRFHLDRIRGVGLTLRGESPTAVVTDNTFGEIYATRVALFGVAFAQWVDSNLFGHTFVSLGGEGGAGLAINVLGQAENRGVYNNQFQKLSVDAFGLKTATAVRIFNSKLNVIDQLYTSPEGKDFPGPIVDDRGCESYRIFSASDSRYYIRGLPGPA